MSMSGWWPSLPRLTRKGSNAENKNENLEDCADNKDVLAIKGLRKDAVVVYRKNRTSDIAEVGYVKGISRMENEQQIFVGIQFESDIGNCAGINKKLMQHFNIPEKFGLIATLNNFKDGKLQLFCEEEKLESKEVLTSKEIVGVEVEVKKVNASKHVLESHISLKRLKGLKSNTHKYGIQGKKNSCYVDTTLFSMFAFTNVFDYILEPPESNNNDDDDMSGKVREILKTDIVNPLRKHLYCSARGIAKLRHAMGNLSPKLEQSYMDVEEFLFFLFDNVLHLNNFVEFTESSDYMHQLFLENGLTRELPKFTTTQILVEMSFNTWDILLREVPHPAYIIAMPRTNGQLKYCDRILPCRQLDISNLIEDGLKKCCLCGAKAYYKCKSCFGFVVDEPGIKSTFFCPCCKIYFHSPESRDHHTVDRLEGRNTTLIDETLNLLAVLCIKSNHYVCYVRCQEPERTEWIFFDSDPSGGNSTMEVLDGFEEQIAALENNSQNLTISDWEKMHPMMKRLLTDIYICIYVKPEIPEDEDL